MRLFHRLHSIVVIDSMTVCLTLNLQIAIARVYFCHVIFTASAQTLIGSVVKHRLIVILLFASNLEIVNYGPFFQVS